MQVIFAVSDLPRAVEFYEHAFGWPRNDRIEYETYVELCAPDGGALGLFQRQGYAELLHASPAQIQDGEVSPAYLYVRVENIERAAERVEAAGGRPLSPLQLRSWGEQAAWFADPDGNVVALAAVNAGAESFDEA